MVGPIKSLGELDRHGGRIRVECRACQRVAYFAIGELAAYFRKRGWYDGWPGFAKRLRCACGESGPKVSWETSPPPPDDPTPPGRASCAIRSRGQRQQAQNGPMR